MLHDQSSDGMDTLLLEVVADLVRGHLVDHSNAHCLTVLLLNDRCRCLARAKSGHFGGLAQMLQLVSDLLFDIVTGERDV